MSGNFLSCLKGVKYTFEAQESCIEGQNLLGFLESGQETLGSSQVVMGASNQLVWLQESQVSIQVLRASTGVCWSHSRGIKPQFAWKGESPGVF